MSTQIPISNLHEKFDTGAIRGIGVAGDRVDSFPLRFDLLMSNISFLERMARTYGEGSIKYGDDNWKQGIPEKSLINHAMAHLIQHLRGDKSEDHLAHLAWNIITLMWMQENRPEMLNLQACK